MPPSRKSKRAARRLTRAERKRVQQLLKAPLGPELQLAAAYVAAIEELQQLLNADQFFKIDAADNPAHAAMLRRLRGLQVRLAERDTAKLRAEIERQGVAVRNHAVRNTRRLIGIDIAANSPKLRKLIVGFRKENVEKIKSLQGQALKDIEQLLRKAPAGTRVESLTKSIQDRFDVTKSKARLLARDQTLKLNGNVQEQAQRDAKIEEYIWTTVGDERTRESHQALDGTTQRWDDPPIVSEDGRREHPGGDYQCRCFAVPAI